MEHSFQTPSDDELYTMIAEQSIDDLETEHANEQYERAKNTLWGAIDSLESHTLTIGRTPSEREDAVDRLQLRLHQALNERDGLTLDEAELKARSEAVYVMSAQQCQDHAEILEIILETLTDQYLAAEDTPGIDPDTKKDLCARTYIDAFNSTGEAMQWLRSIDDKSIDEATPVHEADQWVTIVNAAFQGDCFDRNDPGDLALIMDILLEEEETAADTTDSITELAAEIMEILQTSPDNTKIAHSILGTVIIPAITTKLLYIVTEYEDVPASPGRDAEIDELLRNEDIPPTLANDIKDACDRYQNNLPPDL